MKKVTLPILKRKKKKEKISMVTCYDYTFAKLVRKAEIDTILVGDSLGMVIKGDENTFHVEVDHVAYHVNAVRRGADKPFLIADMPFGSYHISVEDGMKNAVKLIKAGAEAVKVEGGEEVVPLVEKLVSFGIPVVGHVGLTPQHLHRFGNFAMRGKSEEERLFIKQSASLLEQAGASMIVLESIPHDLGAEITESLSIPTIGIGAGPDCDGQVLVLYDILGLDESFYPGFVKKYENLDSRVTAALKQYNHEINSGVFPKKQA